MKRVRCITHFYERELTVYLKCNLQYFSKVVILKIFVFFFQNTVNLIKPQSKYIPLSKLKVWQKRYVPVLFVPHSSNPSNIKHQSIHMDELGWYYYVLM